MGIACSNVVVSYYCCYGCVYQLDNVCRCVYAFVVLCYLVEDPKGGLVKFLVWVHRCLLLYVLCQLCLFRCLLSVYVFAIYIYIYIHTHILCVYRYVYIYMYIYTCIHVSLYMCIYIYRERERCYRERERVISQFTYIYIEREIQRERDRQRERCICVFAAGGRPPAARAFRSTGARPS